MTDIRWTVRALGISLASFGGSITILIQQGELHGIGWALGACALSAAALFCSEIAGGVAGAVRAGLDRLNTVEAAALKSRLTPTRLQRISPTLAAERERETFAGDGPTEDPRTK